MPRPGRLSALALAAGLTLALLVPATARADGMAGAPPADYGPPPTPPGGSAWDKEEEPRRDVHLGNVDHMRLGREDDGSVIMEVRPRPKQAQDQQQVGPFYIYPQIGGSTGIQVGPGIQSGGPSSGRPGQAPSGGQSQFGPGGSGGQPPMSGQGQRPPPPPFGQPGQPGQSGQFGPPGQPWQQGQPGQSGQPGQPGQQGQQGQQGQPPGGFGGQGGQSLSGGQPGQGGQGFSGGASGAGSFAGPQSNPGTPAGQGAAGNGS